MSEEEYDKKALKRTYQSILPLLSKAAKTCGYALAVHGSMKRDLDIVAVPWLENASCPERLAFKLAVACRGLLVGEDFQEPYRRLFHINMPWRGTENRNYIELSVTPKLNFKESK